LFLAGFFRVCSWVCVAGMIAFGAAIAYVIELFHSHSVLNKVERLAHIMGAEVMHCGLALSAFFSEVVWLVAYWNGCTLW